MRTSPSPWLQGTSSRSPRRAGEGPSWGLRPQAPSPLSKGQINGTTAATVILMLLLLFFSRNPQQYDGLSALLLLHLPRMLLFFSYSPSITRIMQSMATIIGV